MSQMLWIQQLFKTKRKHGPWSPWGPAPQNQFWVAQKTIWKSSQMELIWSIWRLRLGGRVHSSTKNIGNTSLVPDPQKINVALLLYIVSTKIIGKLKENTGVSSFGLGTKTFQKQKKTHIFICCKWWCRNIQPKKKHLFLYEYTHMYISICFNIVLCWGLGENAPNLTKYCACAQIWNIKSWRWEVC